LKGCIDWGHGLQVFEDLVYTLESIVLNEDKFFIAIMEQRNLAPDIFIIAFKRFLNGELCRDVACYVPTWHALNNFFTYTYKTVGIRFSYFLFPIKEDEE
jgi:hypothetical protein